MYLTFMQSWLLCRMATRMLIRYKDIVQPHRGGMPCCFALGVLVQSVGV